MIAILQDSTDNMRLLVLVVQVCLTLRSVQPRDSRPNIILILTDDQVTSVSECLMSQVSLAFPLRM